MKSRFYILCFAVLALFFAVSAVGSNSGFLIDKCTNETIRNYCYYVDSAGNTGNLIAKLGVCKLEEDVFKCVPPGFFVDRGSTGKFSIGTFGNKDYALTKYTDGEYNRFVYLNLRESVFGDFLDKLGFEFKAPEGKRSLWHNDITSFKVFDSNNKVFLNIAFGDRDYISCDNGNCDWVFSDAQLRKILSDPQVKIDNKIKVRIDIKDFGVIESSYVIVLANKKNENIYDGKPVILTSDEDWHTVLEAVPAVLWQASSGDLWCQNISNGEKCAYPLLIYGAEQGKLEPSMNPAIITKQVDDGSSQDTISKFVQDYADKVGSHKAYLIADNPSQGESNLFNNLNVGEAAIIAADDLRGFWKLSGLVVATDSEDYETALFAAQLASYYNAPLVFVGGDDNWQDYLKNKAVIAIGDLPSYVADNNLILKLNETDLQHWKIDLPTQNELDSHAVEKTFGGVSKLQSFLNQSLSKDGIILVNPNDIKDEFCESATIAGQTFNSLYCKTSVQSAYLAAAKDWHIGFVDVSTPAPKFSEMNQKVSNYYETLDGLNGEPSLSPLINEGLGVTGFASLNLDDLNFARDEVKQLDSEIKDRATNDFKPAITKAVSDIYGVYDSDNPKSKPKFVLFMAAPSAIPYSKLFVPFGDEKGLVLSPTKEYSVAGESSASMNWDNYYLDLPSGDSQDNSEETKAADISYERVYSSGASPRESMWVLYNPSEPMYPQVEIKTLDKFRWTAPTKFLGSLLKEYGKIYESDSQFSLSSFVLPSYDTSKSYLDYNDAFKTPQEFEKFLNSNPITKLQSIPEGSTFISDALEREGHVYYYDEGYGRTEDVVSYKKSDVIYATSYYYIMLSRLRNGIIASLESIAAIDSLLATSDQGIGCLDGISLDNVVSTDILPEISENYNSLTGCSQAGAPSFPKVVEDTYQVVVSYRNISKYLYDLEFGTGVTVRIITDKYYGGDVSDEVLNSFERRDIFEERDKDISQKRQMLQIYESLYPWIVGEEFKARVDYEYVPVSSNNPQFQQDIHPADVYAGLQAQLIANRKNLVEYINKSQEAVIYINGYRNSGGFFLASIGEKSEKEQEESQIDYSEVSSDLKEVFKKTPNLPTFAPLIAQAELDKDYVSAQRYKQVQSVNSMLNSLSEIKEIKDQTSKLIRDTTIGVGLAVVGGFAGPAASGIRTAIATVRAGNIARGVAGIVIFGGDVFYATDGGYAAWQGCSEAFNNWNTPVGFYDEGVAEIAKQNNIAQYRLGPTSVSDYQACIISVAMATPNLLPFIPPFVSERMSALRGTGAAEKAGAYAERRLERETLEQGEQIVKTFTRLKSAGQLTEEAIHAMVPEVVENLRIRGISSVTARHPETGREIIIMLGDDSTEIGKMVKWFQEQGGLTYISFADEDLATNGAAYILKEHRVVVSPSVVILSKSTIADGLSNALNHEIRTHAFYGYLLRIGAKLDDYQRAMLTYMYGGPDSEVARKVLNGLYSEGFSGDEIEGHLRRQWHDFIDRRNYLINSLKGENCPVSTVEEMINFAAVTAETARRHLADISTFASETKALNQEFIDFWKSVQGRDIKIKSWGDSFTVYLVPSGDQTITPSIMIFRKERVNNLDYYTATYVSSLERREILGYPINDLGTVSKLNDILATGSATSDDLVFVRGLMDGEISSTANKLVKVADATLGYTTAVDHYFSLEFSGLKISDWQKRLAQPGQESLVRQEIIDVLNRYDQVGTGSTGIILKIPRDKPEIVIKSQVALLKLVSKVLPEVDKTIQRFIKITEKMNLDLGNFKPRTYKGIQLEGTEGLVDIYLGVGGLGAREGQFAHIMYRHGSPGEIHKLAVGKGSPTVRPAGMFLKVIDHKAYAMTPDEILAMIDKSFKEGSFKLVEKWTGLDNIPGATYVNEATGLQISVTKEDGRLVLNSAYPRKGNPNPKVNPKDNSSPGWSGSKWKSIQAGNYNVDPKTGEIIPE